MALDNPDPQKITAVKDGRFTQTWYLWFLSIVREITALSESSSGSVYSIYKGKGDIAGVSFDDVENELDWTDSFNSGSDVSVSGSNITINNDGTYKFTVALRTDNANRTELFIRTYINTGSGLTEDPDETVSDYVSRDGDQDTGAVVLCTAFELSDGNVVQFRGFGDTDGTSQGLNEGTRVIVERVL